MCFKLDENLPAAAADVLSAAGHEAHSVVQESLGGASDAQVFAACQAEQRILVTLDADFDCVVRATAEGD